MKTAGILFVFFSSWGLGTFSALELRRRKRQLLELKNSLSFLEREIDYRMASLSEAFCHTAEQIRFPWNQFFSGAGEQLIKREGRFKDVRELMEPELRKVEKRHPWKQDLEILFRLFTGLGELDKAMQLLQIRAAKEETEKKIREAEEDEKQKGRLYQTLGICMGLLGAIMLL